MKILALEFSSEQRSVAIADSMVGRALRSPPLSEGGALGDRALPASPATVRSVATERATRETRAFALIEQALSDAGFEREQLECIAVGLGPGSYTGIRSAIALAQGWQLASGVKLLGISSVECLAFAAREKEWFGKINFVIDAQRNELYFAKFEISAKDMQEIEPLRLIAAAELRAKLGPDEIVAGPDASRWFEQGRILFPEATALAKLAATRNDFVAGEKLEPIYLRETSFVKAPAPRKL